MTEAGQKIIRDSISDSLGALSWDSLRASLRASLLASLQASLLKLIRDSLTDTIEEVEL
jgi:hypothetical protein